MKKKVFLFFKFIPVFAVVAFITQPIIGENYWNLPWVVRLILAFPIIVMFFYLLKLLDLMIHGWNNEKHLVIKKIKSKDICSFNLNKKNFVITLDFYITHSSKVERIISLLNFNNKANPQTLYIYRSAINGKKTTFHPFTILLYSLKLLPYLAAFLILKTIVVKLTSQV